MFAPYLHRGELHLPADVPRWVPDEQQVLLTVQPIICVCRAGAQYTWGLHMSSTQLCLGLLELESPSFLFRVFDVAQMFETGNVCNQIARTLYSKHER